MALYLGNQKVTPIIREVADLTTKTITQNGTYNASSDNADGYSSVTVDVPTSGLGIPREVDREGLYTSPKQGSNPFTFSVPSNAITIGTDALAYALSHSADLIEVDLSSVTTVSPNGLQFAFNGCRNLISADLSSLVTIYDKGLYSAFMGCNSLADIDLSNLTTASTNALEQAFISTNLTSVNFSSLSSIGGNGLRMAFSNCSNLSSLSFPALTSTSFGSYTNQFNSMLQVVNGCTVHFPSNLQSVIGSWTSVQNGFSGTNTTVLFDLTATT